MPVHRVTDADAKYAPGQLHQFWTKIWPEAVRDFGRGGIDLQTTDTTGEVRRSPGDRPVFIGLRRGVLNLVVTDHVPLMWDKSRALAGATAIYDGYHVCVVAVRYAHGDQIPFLAVNTCVHEMLHALLGDVFVNRPSSFQSGSRELRIDSYATGLWLFHDGAAIRKSAQSYLARLRAGAMQPS